MSARKKKDRVKAQREAKRSSTHSGGRPGDPRGVRGAESGQESPHDDTPTNPCPEGCGACPSPCVEQVSADEFGRWIEQSSARADQREKQFREFTETPVGWVMLRANGNRRPAHLLNPDELLRKMPADPKDRNDYDPIRQAWKSFSKGGAIGDPADFIACECPRRGLRDLWNTFAGYEQFYMDVWSLLNSEASRDSATVEPPEDAASMEAALSAALTAFRQAYATQEKDDPRHLFAFDTIHIAEAPYVERLLRAVADACDDYHFGESDSRGSTLWFDETGGSWNHTATAAGYRAAVEVLRSYGVGCEQWSCWD